ncbi:porin [Paraburkholderia sp.]|uniref:porin n=1 Tax=Paraburkholderia sp. TaxID=1926495 RepID=UPI00286EF4DE|nr:porin [Paraburkholderia sp.]
MKRQSPLILTAAALTFAACQAKAQSSVTLYGRLDMGFDYLSNTRGGGADYRLQSANWGASYFGFRGKEDLGGHTHAIFNLEAGIDMASGEQADSARYFNRIATVGISDDDWGTLTLGRTLGLSNYQWDFDPFQQELTSSQSLSRGRLGPVTSNTVSYISPSYRGLSMQAQYAFGNASSGFNNGLSGDYGRSGGVQINYASGPFRAMGMYEELRDSNGRFSNVFVSSREWFGGLSLRTGKMLWQGAALHLSAPDTPAGLASSANEYWFGGKYTLSPALEIDAAVFHVDVGSGAGDATHDAGGHATMFTLGTLYQLSKRTVLYTTLAHVRNSAHSNFSVNANNPGSDNSNSTNPAFGASQTGAYCGVIHYF